MAFSPRSLALRNSLPAGLVSGTPAANRSVSFYNYGTDDAAATVIADGYFNAARDKLKVNDIIEVVAAAGGTGDFLNLIVRTVPASGNVTVAVNGEAAGS